MKSSRAIQFSERSSFKRSNQNFRFSLQVSSRTEKMLANRKKLMRKRLLNCKEKRRKSYRREKL